MNPKAAPLFQPAYVDLSNPYTFAEISQRLYLGLPPFHEDCRKNSSRKRNAKGGKESA
jgi:hypothetical protein